MDEQYGAQYRQLHLEHWWWRSRERLVLGALERLDFPKGASVLDVGCGDGLLFERLQEYGEPEGVEIDARLVRDPRWRQRIHIGPFDERFQPGKTYSLILMLDVLEHLPQPVEAMRHAVSLLEPGGLLLITVPAFPILWTAHDELNHHFTRYTRHTLRQVAAEAGAELAEMRYFFHWTFAAKLLVRLKELCGGRRVEPPRVPATLINRALHWLSCREQDLFGRLPLPWGSSLMAAVRRSTEPARQSEQPPPLAAGGAADRAVDRAVDTEASEEDYSAVSG